ncbi:hypothetical protein CDL12_01130 [Handroanthus impetiginosus]|uniref:Uncharacterized protein n=1 Tax=Handroanthus impetiginosus TaxID=429701 RepID=A0A2G9I8Q3_9LAMI|nr:hypothetical protein CDL12_01130 [Handroanthus impetiginosus]
MDRRNGAQDVKEHHNKFRISSRRQDRGKGDIEQLEPVNANYKLYSGRETLNVVSTDPHNGAQDVKGSQLDNLLTPTLSQYFPS